MRQYVRHHGNDRARHLPPGHASRTSRQFRQQHRPSASRSPGLSSSTRKDRASRRARRAKCSWAAGVARGYLNRPDLTRERFIANPFDLRRAPTSLSQRRSRPRYARTANSNISGAIDHQVKIRGFRIELHEIESMLARHPSVKECAVLARAEAGSEPRLVAYLVAVPGAEAPSVEELRAHLSQKLPEYMVPAAFVFPRCVSADGQRQTRSRGAARARHRSGPGWPSEYVAPQSDLENTLARLMESGAAPGQVGVNDNFFDLGGDSLLLTTLHRHLQDELKREIPITDLFQFPTIRSLAAHLAPGAAPTSAVEDKIQARARQQRAVARAAAGRQQPFHEPRLRPIRGWHRGHRHGGEISRRAESRCLLAKPAKTASSRSPISPSMNSKSRRRSAGLRIMSARAASWRASIFSTPSSFRHAIRGRPSTPIRSIAFCSRRRGKRWRTPATIPSRFAGTIGVFAGCSQNTYLLHNLASQSRFPGRVSRLAADGRASRDARQRQGFPRHAHLLQAEPARSEHRGAVGLLDLARRRLPGLPEPAHFPVRSRAGRWRVGHFSAEARLRLRGGEHRFEAMAAAGRSTPPPTAPFSATASGLVVLKRADEAMRDGDHIHAVIRGFAVNNDGSDKVSYMAPSVEGQAEAIAAAQALAGIDCRPSATSRRTAPAHRWAIRSRWPR